MGPTNFNFALQTDPFAQAISGRRAYHAAPLHYLPSIVKTGRLLSASASSELGVLPRRTASRRDKMLGVQNFVHFALKSETPLLTDKLKMGLPHALFVFDLFELDKQNTDDCAILPFNTKAWRSRADSSPVTRRDQMASLLDSHHRFERYPSMEYLVREWVDFAPLIEVILFCQRDFEITERVVSTFAPDLATKLRLRLTPSYNCRKPITETESYLNFCVITKAVCAIPRIEFD